MSRIVQVSSNENCVQMREWGRYSVNDSQLYRILTSILHHVRRPSDVVDAGILIDGYVIDERRVLI